MDELPTTINNPSSVQESHRLDKLRDNGSGDRQLKEPARRDIFSLSYAHPRRHSDKASMCAIRPVENELI